MKRIILPLAVMATLAANAQSEKAFALTDANKGGYQWNQIRQVNLGNGQAGDLVFNGNTYTAKQINGTTVNMPSLSQSAALAYDKKNDRLYFSPMFTPGTLRYLNLNDNTTNELSFYQQELPGADREAGNFTRMVIGADGNGYAISNDANTFIRFGTGKKAAVENLGGLIDDEKNGGISIHNKCSSWGGDMIADAYGSLYIISIRQNVFKVNPQTRITTLVGQIQGLPAEFTVNGVAVNAEGKVVLSGATYTKSYFTVDLNTLKAEPLTGGTDVYNASDLATGNLYLQAEVDSKLNNMITMKPRELANDKIAVYPNPVTDSRITVSFDKTGAGVYTIDLTDQAAKVVARKVVNIGAKGQSVTMNAESKLAKGMYFIKITDAANRQIFGSPIVVQ